MISCSKGTFTAVFWGKVIWVPPDPAAAKAFRAAQLPHKEGLGFPKMESPPEVAFFTLNGSWLGLYGRESLAEDVSVSSEGSGFNEFALAHNVASETEVDQTIEQALSAGATLVQGRAENILGWLLRLL